MIKMYNWVLSLIIFSAVLILCWVFTVPFNKAPDESAHFGLMSFIAQNLVLPVAGDPELSKVIGRYSVWYGALPCLPYVLGAAGVKVGTYMADNSSLYLFARFMSALAGIGTVYLSFIIVRLLFRDNFFMKISVPLAVLLIPQASFIFSYVNNDAFTLFAITLCYYFISKCAVNGWTGRDSVFLGGSAGLCLLSKPNAYIIIPVIAIFLAVEFFKRYKEGIKYSSILCVSAFIVSGWWFVRNSILYNGDFLAVKKSTLIYSYSYYDRGWSIVEFLFNTPWIKMSFGSFWALFLDVRLPLWYYYIIIFIIMVSLLGFILNTSKLTSCKMFSGRGKVLVLFAFSFMLAVMLSLWHSYTNSFQAQGKYLYASYIPFVILLFWGIDHFINVVFNKKKKFLLGLMMFFFLFMNIYSIIYIHRLYSVAGA